MERAIWLVGVAACLLISSPVCRAVESTNPWPPPGKAQRPPILAAQDDSRAYETGMNRSDSQSVASSSAASLPPNNHPDEELDESAEEIDEEAEDNAVDDIDDRAVLD